MTGILFIGVVTALAVFAILAKASSGGPKRAEKWEKAEIIKQLLALSEGEKSISATAPSVRFRVPLSGMRPAKAHQKQIGKTSQPIRSGKSRFVADNARTNAGYDAKR